MNSLLLLPLLLVPFVALFALWVFTLVDAVRRPEEQWAAAGQSKVLWIVLLVVVGVVLSIVYLFYPRPQLREAGARLVA